MQPTLEALRRARRDKQARRRAAQAAVIPNRLWVVMTPLGLVYTHANTKSEARSAMKRHTGRPLPAGTRVLEVEKLT